MRLYRWRGRRFRSPFTSVRLVDNGRSYPPPSLHRNLPDETFRVVALVLLAAAALILVVCWIDPVWIAQWLGTAGVFLIATAIWS